MKKSICYLAASMAFPSVCWAWVPIIVESFYNNAPDAHWACLAEYDPLPKYTWSSNPITCRDVPAETVGNYYGFKVYFQLFGYDWKTKEALTSAWHHLCPSQESVNTHPIYVWTSCTEHRLYFTGDKCPSGKLLNPISGQCDFVCPEGYLLVDGEKCVAPSEEKRCEARGAHPVDFSDGKKYRVENVISTRSSKSVEFKLQYNNLNNHELTAAGIVGNKNLPIVHSTASGHIAANIYSNSYNDFGLAVDSTNTNQYYGGITQYWRHNFDDVLQIRGGQYTLHFANGESQDFSVLGRSVSYPSQALLMLENGEAAFVGFKWVNYKTGQEKHFDNTGKLRTIKNSTQDLITLTYTNNQLTQIANSFGDYLTLEYSSKATSSIYSAMSTSTQDYVNKVTTNKGQSAQLEWNKNFKGQTATFYLLTRITEPTTSTATTARDFAYSDSRWPASLTDIYTVSDISNNTQKLYAHFEYDDQGRAIYSGLAGGVEAVQVDYADELTSIVTNALGKKATYSFDFISGVKKLKKVVGEPTSSCLRSEVEYTYNPSGTLFEKTQNNRTTRYTQYDSKNLELERIEAFGTADAKTIKTEWHPTLNLKTKVIEPKTTTIWEYFEDGKLKSTRLMSSGAIE